MDVLGLILIIAFYVVILLLGFWIARRKGILHPDTVDELMLAGRKLGWCVATFTLIATSVGGVFVNGSAEETYRRGAIWCVVPIGYSLSMALNGLTLVPKMRSLKVTGASSTGCVTLVDALQIVYGKKLGALIYLPSCLGDLCWTAAVFTALGTTLSVVLDVGNSTLLSVTGSVVAIGYTLMGGMYSVAYTDVLQLLFLVVGLWLPLPFALTSPKSDLASLTAQQAIGVVDQSNWAEFVDILLQSILGGLPWMPYYQRVLSVRTTSQARILSLAATVGCLVLLLPPVLMGDVAKTVDWNATRHAQVPSQPTIVLPAVLANLMPYWVSVIGLAAVCAAVMSSVDSSLLAGATFLTHNVYRELMRPGKRGCEYVWVLRAWIVILGACACLMSISTNTIYGLWVLSGDLGYVVVFPQFVAALVWPAAVNKYGSLASLIGASLLRASIGEQLIGLPALIPLPMEGSYFAYPVKTVLTLISAFLLLSVSALSRLWHHCQSASPASSAECL